MGKTPRPPTREQKLRTAVAPLHAKGVTPQEIHDMLFASSRALAQGVALDWSTIYDIIDPENETEWREWFALSEAERKERMMTNQI